MRLADSDGPHLFNDNWRRGVIYFRRSCLLNRRSKWCTSQAMARWYAPSDTSCCWHKKEHFPSQQIKTPWRVNQAEWKAIKKTPNVTPTWPRHRNTGDRGSGLHNFGHACPHHGATLSRGRSSANFSPTLNFKGTYIKCEHIAIPPSIWF